MCGICGIYYTDPERHVDHATIVAMRDSMTHRGPDDEGVLLDGPLGFGHRRLSIIDLSTGHQPMSNEDDSVWIVFNGEIYNFEELRRELRVLGHRFRTTSDTETILHAYEEFGLEAVQRFNGMFAIALWDRRNSRLTLIRDRLGVKPLYWTQTRDGLIFASEVKGILASGLVASEPDLSGISEYLHFRFVAGDRTLFKGIHSLMPGELLVASRGQVTRHLYWDVPLSPHQRLRRRQEEVEEEALTLLRDSVRLRLISDVPVGTFCSGGLDSSFVSALASQQSPGRIKTFCVGFPQTPYDESDHAARVANHIGGEHHVLQVTGKEFADLLPFAAWLNDEPLNHPNSLPILSLSEFCREHVKVVLTGEGADELLGGYPRYWIIRWLDGEDWFSHLVQMASRIPVLLRSRRLDRLLHAQTLTPFDRVIWNAAFFQKKSIPWLDEANADGLDLAYRKQCFDHASASGVHPVDVLAYLDLKTYLVSILNRQDKMSMGAGIESRVPFLDYRFVEFCMSLPVSIRVGRWRRKALLKKIATPFLPPGISHRAKSGFGVPLDLWFRQSEALGRYLDLIYDSSIAQRMGWEKSTLCDIVDAHVTRRTNVGELLWELLCLELWYRTFFSPDGTGYPLMSKVPV